MTPRIPDICPECGVPFDELPLADCATHRARMDTEPEPTPADIEAVLQLEAARIACERTGDD